MSDESFGPLKKYQDLIRSGKLEETIILSELFSLEERDKRERRKDVKKKE